MQLIRIVLDTNALLRCVSRKSIYAVVLDKLYDQMYELCLSTEILLEYEEKITEIFSKEIAELTDHSHYLIISEKQLSISG